MLIGKKGQFKEVEIKRKMDLSCASECVAGDVDTTPAGGLHIPAGDKCSWKECA